MLKTCLKHDYRAMRKFMGLMMLILLGCFVEIGVASAFYARSLDGNHTIMGILSIIALVGGAFAVAGIVSIAYYYTFVDFYQKFFTDQAYLTFTLPVKRSTLYLSKVICGSLAQLALIGTAIVGVFLAVFILSFSSTFGGQPSDMDPFNPWLLTWIIPILLLLVAVLLFANGLLYLCIVIGGTQARKYKLVAVIGIYYAASTILSIAGTILLFPFLFAGGVIMVPVMMAGEAVKALSIAALLTIAAMIVGCLAAIFHFVAVGMLERKLNLS